MRFVMRRYLPGQAVLAATVRESCWIATDEDFKTHVGDITPLLCRILRGVPGAVITEQHITDLDLNLRRKLRKGNVVENAAAQTNSFAESSMY